MPSVVRYSLLGALGVAALLAAVFIVKAVLALATVALVIVVAVGLFGFGVRFVRRRGAARDVTSYRG